MTPTDKALLDALEAWLAPGGKSLETEEQLTKAAVALGHRWNGFNSDTERFAARYALALSRARVAELEATGRALVARVERDAPSDKVSSFVELAAFRAALAGDETGGGDE